MTMELGLHGTLYRAADGRGHGCNLCQMDRNRCVDADKMVACHQGPMAGKVWERVAEDENTLTDEKGQRFMAVEASSACIGCHFHTPRSFNRECFNRTPFCVPALRADGRSIIWVPAPDHKLHDAAEVEANAISAGAMLRWCVIGLGLALLAFGVWSCQHPITGVTP